MSHPFTLPPLGRTSQPGSDRVVITNPVWQYAERGIVFPDGNVRTFHTIRKKPGVTIVPWTTSDQPELPLAQHRFLMVPQVRPNADHAIGYCFPAGGFEPSDEEEPNKVIACATREFTEEAGRTADTYVDLGYEYCAVHFSDCRNHTVLASSLHVVDTQHEKWEVIGKPTEFCLEEIFSMTQVISPDGQPYFYDGVSMGSLLKVTLHLTTSYLIRP